MRDVFLFKEMKMVIDGVLVKMVIDGVLVKMVIDGVLGVSGGISNEGEMED